MSTENPFNNPPQEGGQEEEQKSNIVEATTPEGKVVRIDIEEVMRRQGVNPSEFPIDDDMRKKLKDGIEKGFTELAFISKSDRVQAFWGSGIIKERPGVELESRKAALRQNAEEILRSAKESGGWVKNWTPEEDIMFVEGYIKTMETMERAAREVPEQTPPARVTIGKWGSEPQLGWEWTDEYKRFGSAPSRKFK